jgi:protein involved in polysaccharide export with SLBB domain
VGDDYVLGIGDELVVSFQGATSDTRTVRVDREGRVVVGQIRPIQAAGRTLGSVRAQLAAETRRTLLATDVTASVGQVRAVSIFVGGEVERPGQYNLTSLADVATALAQAGGVRRTGSLRPRSREPRRRRHVHRRSLRPARHRSCHLDTPSRRRPHHRAGDRPHRRGHRLGRPPGDLRTSRPAIVEAVVAFAGGPLRARGADVVVSRIGPDGSEQFIRAPSPRSTVVAGDALLVVGGSAGGAQNRVVLRGAVDNAGARPIAAAGTVAELVGPAETLRSDAYQVAAALIRRDPATGARVIETINLATALRQSPSPRLRPEDQLVVFSRRDIDFLNSAAVRRVALGQP